MLLELELELLYWLCSLFNRLLTYHKINQEIKKLLQNNVITEDEANLLKNIKITNIKDVKKRNSKNLTIKYEIKDF